MNLRTPERGRKKVKFEDSEEYLNAKKKFSKRLPLDEPENPQLVVGQYAGYADEVRADEAAWLRSKNKPADAIEAALAAPDSATPTFAAARLHVDGARWEGVPWVLVAGKQLNERAAYVRVLFHDSECNPVRRIERSPNAPGHLNAPLHVTHSFELWHGDLSLYA